MIQKPFENLTFTDINDLVEKQVPESRTLDYKRDLPREQDGDKKEFLADVASLANALGGDLVIGLAERRDEEDRNTGTPELYGIPAETNTDQEAQRLVNLIRDGIKPKVPGVQVKFLEGPDGKKFAVIRVSQSWAAPHMVTFKTTPAFYSRTSTGKQPLDIHEIRNSFLGGEHLVQRIQNFRTDRLGKILADDTPCKLFSERRIVLHLFPYQSLSRGISLDLGSAYNLQSPLRTINSRGHDRRYNLDGLLIHDNPNNRDQRFTYLQVYRDGRIEAVESYLLSQRDEDRGGLRILFITLEQALIGALESYLQYYRQSEVGAPVALMLSFLNAKGGFIQLNNFSFDRPEPITDQNLILPDQLIEDLSQPADVILRPCLDQLWNACGFERCLSYGTDGRWRDISRVT